MNLFTHKPNSSESLSEGLSLFSTALDKLNSSVELAKEEKVLEQQVMAKIKEEYEEKLSFSTTKCTRMEQTITKATTVIGNLNKLLDN